MPFFVEKPTIITLKLVLQKENVNEFANWQANFNDKIISFPGFVSLEFISPSTNQKDWLVIQRFSDAETASKWRGSEEFTTLFRELQILAERPLEETLSDESTLTEGVTEVIVTQLKPDAEKSYKEWCAKIHRAEAKFPGFRGVYMQSPEVSKGNVWVTLLQFNTMRNLDNWLQSEERKKLIQESGPLISSLETHRVISPYAGWFSSLAKIGEVPPTWKQTFVILLVLFPIVMLELKFLSPITSGLNISLSTFIGNAISVTLLAFPLLPIAIWFLSWWLIPKNKKNTRVISFSGTCLLLFLYALEILLFWSFV